jgi:hypothetical protein
MKKFAALVPPPKFNIVRYSGVFAPAAGCRSLIVPQVKAVAPPLHGGCQAAVEMQKTESGKAKERRGCQPRNYPWAQLMTRVFGFDVLKCPRCGAKMRILAAINPPAAIQKILACLGLPTMAPPVARAISDRDPAAL